MRSLVSSGDLSSTTLDAIPEDSSTEEGEEPTEDVDIGSKDKEPSESDMGGDKDMGEDKDMGGDKDMEEGDKNRVGPQVDLSQARGFIIYVKDGKTFTVDMYNPSKGNFRAAEHKDSVVDPVRMMKYFVVNGKDLYREPLNLGMQRGSGN